MLSRYEIIYRKVVLILVLVPLIFVPVAHAKSIQIGILYDGDSAQFAKLKSIFAKEIQSITNDSFKLSFPAGSSLSGGWNTEQINQAFDRLMASDKVDMILVLGAVSSYEVCKRRNFTKPIFAANAIIPKLKVISSDSGKSDIHNLNYLNAMRNPDREFQLLRKMVPVKRIAVIVDGFTMESIPELNKFIHSLAKTHNIDAEIVTVNESAKEVAARISGHTDAVLIGSLPRLTNDEFQKLAKDLITQKLPSYSFQGPFDVEMGILVSTIPENYQICLARTVAANILEVLNGADPGRMTTVFTSEEKVTINMATLRAIGIEPYWDLLTGAELINDGTGNVESRLNITMVMEEALAANPDLAAGNQSVEAGIAKVKEARSSLLPQIDLNTRAAIVDGDRALAYSGMLPERHWTGGVQATQLIYSDKAWANYSIEELLQKSREMGRDALKLDIQEAATVTYLNVLRNLSIERIQKENLRLTRENMERARIRVELGEGGPEEIYRWESEIANSTRNVLDAQSNTLDAFSRMNRILNRPLSEMFAPVKADLADPLSILPDRRLTRYMDSPMALEKLREFLVTEGLTTSPELQQIAANVAAKNRDIALAKREFWVPTVSLFGDVTESFAKSGEGADYPSGRNNTDWSAGVEATFPLFSGGKKTSTLSRVQKELKQALYERKSLSNQIEEGIFNAIHLIRASYPGIRLSNNSYISARQNLALVTDSYARGIKSIIDLIDAQNQALVANQQAANAIYDFLIDVMILQRNVGKFFLFESREELDIWLNRLNQHMNASSLSRSG